MKQTINNLAKAFIGESQARNRYQFYAKVAQKEGYQQIGAIFNLTADNEKEHAKRLFEHLTELCKELKDGDEKIKQVSVEAQAPVVYGDTVLNLRSAIDGENYEHTQMYPNFAAVAQKEKLPKIAVRLKAIAVAEKHHEERYLKVLKQVKAGTFFKKDKPTWWVCRECGYVHYDKQPPKICLSCDHAQSYYELKCEKY